MSKIIELSYEDFKSISEDSDLNLSNLISYEEQVIKFIFKTRNQVDFYLLTDIDFIEDSLKDILLKYGICTSKYDLQRSRRVLFIDPSKDFITQINEQLVDGVDDFTNLVVLTDDNEVVKETLSKVKEVYPEIASLQFTYSSEDYDSIMSSLKETLGTDRLYDIKDYCEALSGLDELSAEYIDYFNKSVYEIHQSNPNGFIYVNSNSKYDRIAESIFGELYLQYGEQFYVPTSRVNRMISLITNNLCDKDKMLVEDFVNYFNNHPRYMINKAVRIIDGYSFVIMDQGTLSLSINYFPANQLDSLENIYSLESKVFSSSEIDVLPLSKVFELNDNSKKVKDVINLFYKKVNNSKNIVSVIDLVYFVKDGQEYIGYLNKFSINIPYIKYSELGAEKLVMDYRDFSHLIPVTVFLDGPMLCKESLKMYFPQCKYKKSYVDIPKSRYPGISILGSSYRLNNRWNELETISPLTIGIGCNLCYKFRLAFYKELKNILGLQKVRELADIYGGFNPVFTKSINL